MFGGNFAVIYFFNVQLVMQKILVVDDDKDLLEMVNEFREEYENEFSAKASQPKPVEKVKQPYFVL